MPTPQKYTSIMHFKKRNACRESPKGTPFGISMRRLPGNNGQKSDDNDRKSIENSHEADDLRTDCHPPFRKTAYQPVYMIVLFSLRAVKKKTIPKCRFQVSFFHLFHVHFPPLPHPWTASEAFFLSFPRVRFFSACGFFPYIYEKIRMIRCKRILKKDLIHPSLPTIMYTV